MVNSIEARIRALYPGDTLQKAKELDRIRAYTTLVAAREKSPSDMWELGVEREFYMTDFDGNPGTIPGVLWNEAAEFGEPEVGDHTFEWKGEKLTPASLEDLEAHFLDGERIVRMLAERHGLLSVPIGIIPNVHPRDINRHPKNPRHQLILDYTHQCANGNHRYFAGEDFTGIALQFNIATHLNITLHPEETPQLYHVLFEIAPYAVALGGNSRVIMNQDSGFTCLRAPLREQYHPLASRQELALGFDNGFGVPDPLPQSMEEHVELRLRHPNYVLQKEGRMTVGHSSQVVRPKFFPGTLVLEFRAPPVQPTSREETAMAAFVIGLLEYRRLAGTDDPLRANLIKDNLDRASIHGLRGYLHTRRGLRPADEILGHELENAATGLERLYNAAEVAHYLRPLWKRVEKKRTPSNVFVERASSMGVNNALLDMVENARTNRPYL